MPKVEITKLIEAGAHFGHLTRRWNPKMKPYIFMEKNGIHIIDLKKTQEAIEVAANALTNVVSHGKGVLFVGTKKQAQGTIAAEAKRCDSNWVSERWLGGMLTNFQTIRKSIKRLQNIDKMETDGTFEKITKKERLTLSRERDKLRRILDGVETMGRLPGAIFLVDIKKESIAVQEAHRLNIPTFAMVDTNCDPDEVDYVIPANDDASRTIELISGIMADAVAEGQAKAKELKAHESAEKEKEKKIKEEKEEADGSKSSKRVRKVRLDGKSGQRKPRKHSRHEDELKQGKESASAKEEPVKTEPKKDVVEEKKDKDETEKK
ncbi:MAG: 30S ribosomal protein S2 [Melioribacteraceae bacterium]|nr:30S ribosomal protein S2 [Melioribacteraceae bacterium]MCF8353286.1 30S ribosomal protein S2 [Melioribacteraceae bacterium]MCF8394828.1 30S ribosomal protein S2 [Melioribacteraceae bacterium]MCF8418813.1 30S ribosomal protein S2 [Melioribacteraceae bacterium]